MSTGEEPLVIDITCPSCDITYHADENHIGRGFRCKVCGKILAVEHLELAPIPLREVVQATTSKQKVGRDRQVGVGILVVGAVFFAVWLLLRSPNADEPHHIDVPELKMSPPVERLEMPKNGPVRPIILRTKKVMPEPENLQPVVVVPACAQGQQPVRLATGERIEPDEGTDGAATLKIKNGLGEDAAVRLIDTATNNTSRFVYIQAHDEYTIKGIESGNYSVLYATGSDWMENCVEFQRNEEINEFEKSHAFEDRVFDKDGDEHHRWTEGEISLNPVPLGNARTKTINRKRFFQGDQHFTLPPQ
jgi:hypothetical protein